MRYLGQYLTQGMMQSVIGVSLLTLLSMIVTPLAYILSGAPLGLLTLRKGSQSGLKTAVASTVLVGLILGLTGLRAELVVAFAFCIWIPVWLGSSVLRLTQSQGLMLTMTGTLGLLFVMLIHYSIDDVTAWWRDRLFLFFQGVQGAENEALLVSVVDKAAANMTGACAVFMVINITLAVLIARWWQSKLFFPNAFKPEFLSLRLPRAVLVVMAASAAIVYANAQAVGQIAGDFMVVLVCMYVFQGISFMHGVVHRKKLSSALLVMMYTMLLLPFLTAQAAIFLACLGVADSVLGGSQQNQPPNGDNQR